MTHTRHPIHSSRAGIGTLRAPPPEHHCCHCGPSDPGEPEATPPQETPPEETPPVPAHLEPAKLVLSVEESATALGISRGLAYQLVRTGEIPTIRLGRRLVVPRARLAAVLEGDSGSGEERC